MTPLIYGYMRAPDDVSDRELDRAITAMRRYAEAEDFCYATTFFEYRPGARAAFEELVLELRRARARYVVVPALDHLSAHRLLRASMVERLERSAGARVLTPGGGGPEG